MDTKFFRLTTNDMIIAEVESEDDLSYNIKNPVQLIIREQPGQEEPSMGLAPFVTFCPDPNGKTDITIQKNHVLFTHEPAMDLLNSYNNIHGAGIQIASASDIPRS